MFARSLTTRHATRRPGILARLHGLLDLRASRARLADLDDHLLHDIGISRDQAEAELDRPLWDAPAGWRR